MASQTEIRDAIHMLAARAQGVISAETMEKRASESHADARQKLEVAQNYYDQALEKAMEVFPQLTKGYNLNPETVAIGDDGRIHVVPEVS